MGHVCLHVQTTRPSRQRRFTHVACVTTFQELGGRLKCPSWDINHNPGKLHSYQALSGSGWAGHRDVLGVCILQAVAPCSDALCSWESSSSARKGTPWLSSSECLDGSHSYGSVLGRPSRELDHWSSWVLSKLRYSGILMWTIGTQIKTLPSLSSAQHF